MKAIVRTGTKAIQWIHWYLGSRKFIILMWLLKKLEHMTGSLLTYHARPLYAKGLGYSADPLIKSPSCAIVIQGAILHTEQFTLETVRMYKKMYPFAHIIVSTWEHEDCAQMETEEGVHIIYNRKPEYNGPYNLNLQITSAPAGVTKAKELGAEFTLKTRTDHRMYNRNAFETMTNMLNYFKPSERSNQKKRILLGTGGNVFRPYLIPDMFVFGDTDDMLELWSAPLVPPDAPHPGGYKTFIVELYLGIRYFTKKGWGLDWTTQQMWDIQRECLVTLNWSDLDIYIYKYFRYREFGELRNYQEYVPGAERVGFEAWFNIFSNKENKLIPENSEK